MNARDRLWSLGAVLLAVGVALGGWFGAISPSLDAAARADDDRSSVETQNSVHETRLIALEDAATRIDELKAEHDALTEGLPAGEEYAVFLRDLDALAGQSGVTLSGVSTSPAQVYLPPVEAAVPEPAAETGTEPEGDAAQEPTEAPAQEAIDMGPVPFTSPLIDGDNLAAIPVTVSAVGSTEALSAFLHSLQMGTRLVSVSSASFTEPTDIDPGQLDISGFLYAMPTDEPAP